MEWIIDEEGALTVFVLKDDPGIRLTFSSSLKRNGRAMIDAKMRRLFGNDVAINWRDDQD